MAYKVGRTFRRHVRFRRQSGRQRTRRYWRKRGLYRSLSYAFLRLRDRKLIRQIGARAFEKHQMAIRKRAKERGLVVKA